jgi:hypothetical protein
LAAKNPFAFVSEIEKPLKEFAVVLAKKNYVGINCCFTEKEAAISASMYYWIFN